MNRLQNEKRNIVFNEIQLLKKKISNIEKDPFSYDRHGQLNKLRYKLRLSIGHYEVLLERSDLKNNNLTRN